ncbi:hypothetical protein SMAC4_13793 [Sordaria macrospora]|uniref:uncharacterized protein n=1 Tax=Sordaria macrospora TaxID=5147 RepID=UPI002B2BC295|nr:hypothetical protein SMAC4_13793 [Sordaria macrospora]
MMDRAKAMSIIHSTIRDEKVQNVLSINGWDEDNDDPKYLFDFIKNSISSVTNEAKSDVLDEYQTIKCASFATLESLRKRVKDVGYKIDDTVELTNLFNAVKHSFPNEALLWAADMNKNELTTITFLARLSTLANTQKNYTNMVAAKVEVKTKDSTKEVKTKDSTKEVKTKDSTKEVKTETNGDERVACDVWQEDLQEFETFSMWPSSRSRHSRLLVVRSLQGS